MVMAAKAFLDENADPTADEVRKAISGNLCRCTGYQQIVDAVMAAASAMKGK
jgi:aerobic-type carbon monoxide dehydrogenase small subunit (CoxS/CutS family)